MKKAKGAMQKRKPMLQSSGTRRVVKKGHVIWWGRKTPFNDNACVVHRFIKDAVEELRAVFGSDVRKEMWRIQPVTMGCERALKG